MKRLLFLLLPLLLARGAGADVACSTTPQTCATGSGSTVSEYTVAALPASPGDDELLAIVTDGASAGDCTTGSGSTRVLCGWTGSAWAAIGDGNSGAAPTFADVGTGSNTTATMICGTGCAITTGGSGTVDATTAAALAADGADCGAGQWAAGVDAAGAAEGCTADDDVPDAGEVDDTALAAGAVDGGTGGEIADDSITAADIDETGAFNFANLRGKINRTGTSVDDDDCTGEQGYYWWDSTDSAFEFCNANSGAPATLGGSSSGITLKCKGAPALATTGTTEEVLATCSLSAGELSAAGHAIRVSFFAHTAANNNTKDISVRVGGISGTVVATASGTSANNWNYTTTTPITVTYLSSTTATSGGQIGRATTSGASWAIIGAGNNRSASITWANALDVVITGTTATASGDLTLDTYQVELLK